jgi:ketosteroid isomerase-like protein
MNAAVSAVLLASGCGRDIKNKDAVRQGVIDYLNQRKAETGLDVQDMNVDVSNVTFQNKEANATVAFQSKGTASAGMSMNYVLERKGDKWVVKGRKESGFNPHGAQGLPGSSPAPNALPPGHPPTARPAE